MTVPPARPSRFHQPAVRLGGTGGGAIGWWLVAILGAIILFVPMVRYTDLRDLQYPTGYTAVVDRLLHDHIVQAPANDDGRSPGTVAVPADLAAADGELEKAVSAFRQNSFLGGDLSPDNAEIWDWGREQIEPSAHRILGPFDDLSGWKGSILFRSFASLLTPDIPPTGDAKLVLVEDSARTTDGRTVQYALGVGNPVQAVGDPLKDACERVIDLASGASRGCPAGQDASKIDFTLGDKEVDLLLVGDKALFHTVGARSLPVTVNGVPLGADASTNRDAQGESDFAERYYALQPGARFAFDLGRRRFRLVRVEPTVSARGPGATRLREPGLENFAQALEAPELGDGDNVQTTLVSELQKPAEKILWTVAARVQAGQPTAGRNFRAGAVLMDGLTGEIAALPTWPRMKSGDPAADTGSTGRRMLERNSNFVRLPIGSAAKPPFAMAITVRYPELLNMRVYDPGVPVNCLMGKRLFGQIASEEKANTYDFRNFIAHSDNKYALELMMLGLAEGHPNFRAGGPHGLCGGEQYGFGPSGWLQGRPPLGPVRARAGGGEPWDAVSGFYGAAPEWRDNLARLFCLVPAGKDPVPESAFCRASLWPNGPQFHLSDNALLEGQYFGFNDVRYLLPDYLMSVLGGNRSRWTTIRLAQTYARIVTARAVSARLNPAGKGELLAPLLPGLNGYDRLPLLEGMEQVLTEGTATAVQIRGPADLGDGTELRYFAKTGTPNLAQLDITDDRDKPLQGYAASPCGLRAVPDPGNRGLFRLAVGDDGAARVTDDAIRAAAAGPRCATVRAQAATLASGVRAINASLALRQRIRVEKGRVTELPPLKSDAVAKDPPKGRALVLIAARYPKAAPVTSQPCTASVVAVNFQARDDRQGNGTNEANPHIWFMRMLVNDPVITRWFRRPAPGCRARG